MLVLVNLNGMQSKSPGETLVSAGEFALDIYSMRRMLSIAKARFSRENALLTDRS